MSLESDINELYLGDVDLSLSKLLCARIKKHVAPVSSGFHVSLRGTFGPSSHLAIAYAAFNYMDCFAGADFLCQNHRCIPSQLNCDGFDHCGDNSDEPATCFQDTLKIYVAFLKFPVSNNNRSNSNVYLIELLVNFQDTLFRYPALCLLISEMVVRGSDTKKTLNV